MAEKEPVIYTPREDETLKEYLARYTPEEKRRIFQNPDSSVKLATLLVETTWISEHEKRAAEQDLENLWNILRHMDYNALVFHIRELEPVRERLLESLEKSVEVIESISKWCNYGRLLGCTLDSIGTAVGLWLTNKGSKDAKLVLQIATGCGAFSFANTLLETKIKSDTFEDLRQQIQEDQDLFAPIKIWYKQSSDLEKAMKKIFRFDVTNKILKEFSKLRENEMNRVRLLSNLLTTFVEQNSERFTDEELIENLVRFLSCPSSQALCECLIFRRQHAVNLDVIRMVLYRNGPELASGHQNMYSIAVWGRMAVNALSIVDSISSLYRSHVPETFEMKRLKRHLSDELIALRRTKNFIFTRRNY